MNAFLVTKIEQLRRYEASYNNLLQKSDGFERIYYSPENISTSIETYREMGAELFFIVVVKGEEVIAVIPFQLVRDAVFDVRRTLNFWGALEVYANNTFQRILADGHQPAALNAAVSLLKNECSNKWAVISLSPVNADKNMLYFVSQFEGCVTKPSHLNYYYFTSDVDLNEHLGKQNMKALRRRERRLHEDCGQIDFEIKDGILKADLEEINALHTARQELKDNEGAFFGDELEGPYMDALIRLWNEQQCVRYYALRAEDKLIAFQIMLHVSDVAVCFAIAFDSALKKYAPMRLLEYKAFQYEIESCGTKRIESGNGEDTDVFKCDHSSGKDMLHVVQVQNDTARAKAVAGMIAFLLKIRARSSALDALAKGIQNLTTRE